MVKSCSLTPSDPNSGKMELVLKLGENGESDRQNWNMRVSSKKLYVVEVKGEMGKNYAVVGTEANLQSRYIGKYKFINSTLKYQINQGVLVNRGIEKIQNVINGGGGI